MLVSDGEDLRTLPLSMRKTNLARLLARRPDGIFVSDFEQGEIGPDLFRHACLMGLEGLVSKHRESPYRGGRFDRWGKVKNRQHPSAEHWYLCISIRSPAPFVNNITEGSCDSCDFAYSIWVSIGGERGDILEVFPAFDRCMRAGLRPGISRKAGGFSNRKRRLRA